MQHNDDNANTKLSQDDGDDHNSDKNTTTTTTATPSNNNIDACTAVSPCRGTCGSMPNTKAASFEVPQESDQPEPTSAPATATISSSPSDTSSPSDASSPSDTQVAPVFTVVPISTSGTPHQIALASAFALVPATNTASIAQDERSRPPSFTKG